MASKRSGENHRQRNRRANSLHGMALNKVKILFASLVARWAHWGQKRKYTGEPYFTHCNEVADMVASIGGTTDAICAAYLHDTLEDTWVWEDFLAVLFGERVAMFVSQVTDYPYEEPRPNRDTRNKVYNAHLARGDWYAKTIKFADIICNLQNLERDDPKFAKVYFAEKREQLKTIGEYGDMRLRKYANHLVEDYFARNPGL